MAMWPHYVISLVIISNNILISLSIALTYYFICDNSLFWYTKPYSYIIRNSSSYIALLKSVPAVILYWQAYHLSLYFIQIYFFCSSTSALQLMSSWF